MFYSNRQCAIRARDVDDDGAVAVSGGLEGEGARHGLRNESGDLWRFSRDVHSGSEKAYKHSPAIEDGAVWRRTQIDNLIFHGNR